MQTVDFARSFLYFRNDHLKRPAPTASHAPPSSLNNARILLDCVCEIIDKETGAAQTFVAGASCKTERVGVERDIWLHPNADFVPIFSHDRFLIVKTYDIADKGVPFYPPSRGMQPERQVGRVADAFESVRLDIRRVEGKYCWKPPPKSLRQPWTPTGLRWLGAQSSKEAGIQQPSNFQSKQ